VYVLGAIMHHFSKETLLNLKYLSGNEKRHFVWDCADDFRLFGEVGWNPIRCACTKHILADDPRTIPWPWPVDPLTDHEVLAGMPDGFEFDTSFWGWRTPLGLDLTVRACAAAKDMGPKRLKVLEHQNKFFFGWKTEEEADYRPLREGFIKSLYNSRLSLVPRSIDGVIRYRLYEQMSMGRGLPIHLCDNVVMPWQSKIDWDTIIPKLNVEWPGDFDHTGLSCPEAEVDSLGHLLVEWLAEHDDADIRKRAAYGLEMYNQWLHRDRWDELFGIVAKERLEGKL